MTDQTRVQQNGEVNRPVHAVPPKPLSTDGEMAENWKFFKQSFDIYLRASRQHGDNEQDKFYKMLNMMGEPGIKIYNTFEFTEEAHKTSYTHVVKKFEEKFIPTINTTYERYIFFTQHKKNEQSYEDYVTNLRKLAETCEFGDLRDSLIKDQLILGMTDKGIKDRLLREEKLTLNRAIELCKIAETTARQLQDMDTPRDSPLDIQYVTRNYSLKPETRQHKPHRTQPVDAQKAYKRERNNAQVIQNTGRHQVTNLNKNCTKCGKSHQMNRCPAYGKMCYKCNQRNHYASKCVKNVNLIENSEIESNDYSSQEEDLYIDNLQVSKLEKHIENGWFENCTLNKKLNVKFRLDTGADCNILPMEIYKKLKILTKVQLQPAQRILRSVTGEKLKVFGIAKLEISTNNNVCNTTFYVITGRRPLLGLETCQQLNLMVRNVNHVRNEPKEKHQPLKSKERSIKEIIERNEDVFHGIGCLKEPYTIKIDPNVTPKIHPPRRVPYAMQETLKKELGHLEKQGIITRVTTPTEWVNSLVIVTKPNGKLRLCMDPRDLNQAIKREHVFIPSLEDIVRDLNGAKYFSTVDCSSGFWQIPLDEDSSKLCTFNTPFGRYRFLRMPYGLSSAPEVYQNRMHTLFESCEGIGVYIDDILIYGKTIEEHNERLQKVFNISRQNNLKLNYNKCQFGVNEIKYLGHVISKEGLKIDKSKIEAIEKMQSPQNKKDLERFLGCVNYLSKFIPNYSEVTAPLRELMKKDTHFDWQNTQEQAFNKIKHLLASPPVLQFYNPEKPVTISCDASQQGCGAVLLQEDKPIAYASKAFTKSQLNYAQIEKELLAMVFGCNKFRQYIYGRTDVTVETDHKPLIHIRNKPLNTAPLRLQRMLLALQPYQFILQYKPGNKLFVADTLSRAFLKTTDPDFENKFKNIDEFNLNYVEKYYPIASDKLGLIKTETENDEHAQRLIELIKEGFPVKKDMKDEWRQYYTNKNELSVSDGVIFLGNRIYVPKSLRSHMLEKIHKSHLGVSKSQWRAREILYWQGMNNDIKNFIENCDVCNSFPPPNKKEPLIAHKVPKGPWEKIAVDFFDVDANRYILVTDYFSKFIQVDKLQNYQAESVITYLKKSFAILGIPVELMSDEGPPFNSKEFNNFTQQWGITHTTSSAHYPRSNGQVERQIATAKRVIRKTIKQKGDVQLAMLELVNTPLDGNLPSPAQILHNRRCRTLVPIKKELLESSKINLKVISKRLVDKQIKSKTIHDKSAGNELKPLKVGQRVKVKNFKGPEWSDGLVISKAANLRSYKIKLLKTNNIVTRNRFHLKPVPGNTIAFSNDGIVSRKLPISAHSDVLKDSILMNYEILKPECENRTDMIAGSDTNFTGQQVEELTTTNKSITTIIDNRVTSSSESEGEDYETGTDSTASSDEDSHNATIRQVRQPAYQTRAGRIPKLPQYLKDYKS